MRYKVKNISFKLDFSIAILEARQQNNSVNLLKENNLKL